MMMIHHRALALIALAGLLLAGCSGPRQGGASKVEPASKQSRVSDEKMAEAHAHYAQALIYELNGEAAPAMEEFAKAAAADPSNEELVLELARRYMQSKEPEKALALLQKAAAIPGASADIHANLGLAYMRLEKPDLALTATQAAIKRNPKAIAGHRNLFIIRLQKGPPQDALKVLDQALKVPDTGADYLIELAGLYINLQREAPALKQPVGVNGLAALDRAAKLPPGHPRMTMKMADEYNLLGNRTNAAKLYLKLLEKYGEAPTLRNEIHTKLAEIYLRDRDSAKAMEQLEAIVREDPGNAQAHYLLGSLALEERKWPEAVNFFQKTLILDDEFEQGYYDLAVTQVYQNKPRDALATLQKARSKFARNFRAEYIAGIACMRDKSYTNAVEHFISAEMLARASDPDKLTGPFYFELGAAFERKGDFDQAEKYFEKSLALSPKLPEALNYYGYMLADKGIKLDKARKMIDEAVRLDPKNAAYLDSLGWVLFRQGKVEDALKHIEEAVRLSEEPDPTLFDHLGDIYIVLKQPQKAREAWQKSLGIEPNAAIQKKLDDAGK